MSTSNSLHFKYPLDKQCNILPGVPITILHPLLITLISSECDLIPPVINANLSLLLLGKNFINAFATSAI